MRVLPVILIAFLAWRCWAGLNYRCAFINDNGYYDLSYLAAEK